MQSGDFDSCRLFFRDCLWWIFSQPFVVVEIRYSRGSMYTIDTMGYFKSNQIPFLLSRVSLPFLSSYLNSFSAASITISLIFPKASPTKIAVLLAQLQQILCKAGKSRPNQKIWKLLTQQKITFFSVITQRIYRTISMSIIQRTDWIVLFGSGFVFWLLELKMVCRLHCFIYFLVQVNKNPYQFKATILTMAELLEYSCTFLTKMPVGNQQTQSTPELLPIYKTLPQVSKTEVILSPSPTVNFLPSLASVSQTLTQLLFKCGTINSCPCSQYALLVKSSQLQDVQVVSTHPVFGSKRRSYLLFVGANNNTYFDGIIIVFFNFWVIIRLLDSIIIIFVLISIIVYV